MANPPSPLHLLQLLVHRPRFLALVLIPVLFLLFKWQSSPSGAPSLSPDDPRFVRVKEAPQGGSWEALADVDEEWEYSDDGAGGKWGSGVSDWLGWKQEEKQVVLVTGGSGQLGQALIPLLLLNYTIHVQDIVPRPSTLPESVIYHRTLSPTDTYADLFASYSFDGVIHLAGVSLDSWCSAKEEECRAVNVEGTRALMQQVVGLQGDKKRGRMWRDIKVPWVILGSTMDVYGPDVGASEDSDKEPATALGRTKLEAEQVFVESIISDDGSLKTRGMILRVPQVYGYHQMSSIPETFVTALLANALTSLPIQFSSSRKPYDLLHVQDALAGYLKAISWISTDGPLSEVPDVNLVTGKRTPAREVVELVRKETNSKSPVRDIGDNSNPEAPQYNPGKGKSFLDWEAEITPLIGMSMAVTQLSDDIAAYSRAYLHAHCPPSPDFPAKDGDLSVAFVEDERNKPLWKLDGCTVNVGFNHNNYLHHVKCEDGLHCRADGVKVTAMNWNQSVWIVEKVDGSKKQKERVVRIRLKEESGMGYLRRTTQEEGAEMQFELSKENGPDTVFDLEVRRDSSHLRLLIPGTDLQVRALANQDGTTTFTAEPLTRFVDPHFDMRMNVLCCSSEGDWPLLLDDYESADIRFGNTGQISFESSRRSHLCLRAEQAVKYNYIRLSTAKQAVSKVTGTAGHAFFGEAGPPTDPRPNEWALKDLPVCWNDCDSPTICVQTGICKCVQADHCAIRRENPLLKLYPTNKVAEPVKSDLGSFAGHSAHLSNAVSSINWQDILLPAARAYLKASPEFPKLHVADGYDGQEAIEAADCHKLQDSHCFSADSILYRGMRHLSVSKEQAELVVLPVYQQCTGQPFLLHDVVHHATETIPGVKEGNKHLAVVLTHDWGICSAFAWEIWSARDNHTLYPDWILNDMIVWSVMGDYDSPCYRPHQDVVIPARTCRSYTLRETFPTVESIHPMNTRPNLLTWSGTYWGTGKSDRLRMTCDRGGAGDRELIKGGGKQSNFGSWDYMKDLSNARFCPQPRGIAGWSPRTNDAIWAGCIPVLIAEGSHYPFADFLDWSKFSVRVAPTELDKIERILAAIPLSKVEEMQANLVSVREAFVYAGDEKPEEELERRGPMFFALHEAALRMRTRYPIASENP
ncbi:hypothetical protein L198_07566 [Cryptococcus wingfieldii CBS 7118]|uniref:Exostosin GT47 domain-containing protein n=1 Tax=Cryptococcus wingfieldii CBS 7118 TaxID=1295528 RepID=A0A1E3I9X3_9TREE|nr:hypothetical protein L198_07566 [Cryptococcus wingfieldii CBS 7118]ODN85483.1 hypothetical protein L198_07566 [Cryptococcus wingfieldii CBS 7118]